MGNDVNNNVSSTAAIQSASDILTSGLNAAFTSGESKKQRKFTREMFYKQRNAAQETYKQVRADNLADYERQRQDYISDLLNADIRSVASRRNAGLSIAFGDGYSAAQPLGQDIRTSDYQVPQQGSASVANVMPFHNPLSAQNILTSAQAELYRAEAKKAEKEAEGQMTTNEQLKLNLDKARQTFDADVAQAQANLDKTLSEIGINKEQQELIKKNVSKVSEEIRSIQFDVDQLKPQELKNLKKNWEKMSAEIRNLDTLSDINEVEKSIKDIQLHFNEMGIGVGSGLFDSVLGLLTSGKGGKAFDQLKSFVSDIFKGLVNIDIPSIVDGITDGGKKLLGSASQALYNIVEDIAGKEIADKIDTAPADFVKWLKDHLK